MLPRMGRACPYPSPLQGGVRFFRHPYPHAAIIGPYGLLTPDEGSGSGLPRSASLPSGSVRSCLFAGWRCECVRGFPSPRPGRLPFWFKPISIFGLLFITAFISSSHYVDLEYDPILAPDRLDAGDRSLASRFRSRRCDEATLSLKLHTSELPPTHVQVGYWWHYTRLRAEKILPQQRDRRLRVAKEK
jgi:hypothetical protein